MLSCYLTATVGKTYLDLDVTSTLYSAYMLNIIYITDSSPTQGKVLVQDYMVRIEKTL